MEEFKLEHNARFILNDRELQILFKNKELNNSDFEVNPIDDL